MKAVIFDQFGSPEVLRYADRPIPKPHVKQALIKVHAAGLNPIDYKIREGTSFVCEKLKDHLPSGLGFELAGEIIACGDRVDTFQVGDAVLGLAGFVHHPCCYAEFVCADVNTIIHKPASLPFLVAGGMTLAGLTAWQAVQRAKITAGQKVLIHAAAGGVGHIAVQLAKQLGADVVATAAADNHPFLHKLGADQCIDYKTQNFVVEVDKVDVVLDLMGGTVGVRSCEVLAPDGIMITVPTVSAAQVIAAARQKKRHAVGMVMEPNMRQLSLLAHSKLILEVGRTFKLSEAQTAHKILERGHGCGKLIFSM